MIVPMELEQELGNSQYAEINDKATEIGNKIADEFENIRPFTLQVRLELPETH